jgi:hypothetical protein
VRPARRFALRKGQRHLPGLWWSFTVAGHVGCESWLERDHGDGPWSRSRWPAAEWGARITWVAAVADELDNVPVHTAVAVTIGRNPLAGIARTFRRSPIAGTVLAGAVPLPAFVVGNPG